MSRAAFPAVRIAGNLVPAGLLPRVLDDPSLPGREPATYQLGPHESVREAATRAFDHLSAAWTRFAADRDRALAEGRPVIALTRSWLAVLLQDLGYGVVAPTPPGGITVDGVTHPVTHRWTHVPVHLLGWGTDLDRRTPGVEGAARSAPQSMLQELLNRSEEHLYALLSNGRVLRLLRDSRALAGSAHLEFDLDLIFTEGLYSDFVLLYRMAHATRFAVDDGAAPAQCRLEEWRTAAVAQGERALEKLRLSVKAAIEALGTGFLRHPANDRLRDDLREGRLSLGDYNRAVLRLVYRLLFWFVAEDRELLPVPLAGSAARERYRRYFASRRLRDRARRGSADAHHDLWEQVGLVFAALGSEDGLPVLGLPALGGLFGRITRDERDRPLVPSLPDELDAPLDGLRLANEALLAAVRHLGIVAVHGQRRTVDFRNLASEELGSVYESLLELHPRHDAFERTFTLAPAAGNERKTTGSYYTPGSLTEALLDTALDPVLDRAVAGVTGTEARVAALLAVTVCDPACGSGHFLVAAARRIARRVAAERSGEDEPGPDLVQAAMREVVSRCVHGVDVNEMAVELAKVALWMESVEADRPLAFLDVNLRVGNSLLGVTPALLAGGVPDAAITVLAGDDRGITAGVRADNKEARNQQGSLFALESLDLSNVGLGSAVGRIVRELPLTLRELGNQRRRLRLLDERRRAARLGPDTWCAAFVQPTATEDDRKHPITDAALREPAEEVTEKVAGLAARYRFFHWHLEFPHVFAVPEDGEGVDAATGWAGGFDCVIGNPPWERVKLQEKEFFAGRHEGIATARTAAVRKALIAALAEGEPADRALHDAFTGELRRADGETHLLRDSGRYPLTGRGDINTYAVFAELGRTVLAPRGQVGMVLPTGIATDATTQHFFADLVRTRTLASVYDFENEDKVFADVDHRVRFCLWTASGRAAPQERIDLAFRLRQVPQIAERRFLLTPAEIRLLNPNTGTCPVFDSRRNAEITLGIYRRVPVLWDEHSPAGNPWQLTFRAMLHMSNDSGKFRVPDDLDAEGWDRHGTVYARGQERMLPLYEAKMLHHFDHRLGTYEGQTQAQANVGTLPRLTPAQKDDPEHAVLPRYWVAECEVEARLVDERRGWRWDRDWLLGWRDICRSSDVRTVIPSILPRTGIGHTFPLLLSPQRSVTGLLADLSSIVFDFVARQKIAGTHLTYGYLTQLPVLPPDAYDRPCPWSPGERLEAWVTARVLELAYTAHDLAGFARDHGDPGPPFRWDERRRSALRAELDAAYFHLYGVTRPDVEHVLDSFRAFRNTAPERFAATNAAILETYDAMATAIIDPGAPHWRSPLDPPPGHGPRHPEAVR